MVHLPMPPLVSTDWLARRLGIPGLIVVDASVAKIAPAEGVHARAYRPAAAEFEIAGHISGARYADLLHDFSDSGAEFAFTRPNHRQLERAAGALGLSPDSQIVVYDRQNGIWAARLWWLLRAGGHEDVAVLDGGLAKWVAEGRPVAFGTVLVKLTTYRARPRDGYFVDMADVVAIVEGRARGRLACVLRPAVFSGEERSYARAGHIPRSVSVPYVDLLDGRTNGLLSADGLRARLETPIGSDERVILYCGGGITAAGTALALATLGVTNVAIYDGSLAEWSADASLPMEVGLD